MTRALPLLVALAACRPAPAAVADASTPAPTRVATLAPSLTAVVLALGAGDRLVAVTRFDDDPAVKGVARVGGFNDPSAEALLALAPDLVVCQPSPGNKGAVEALRRVGLRVEVLPLERSIDDVSRTFRSLAGLLQVPEAATPHVARLEAAVAHAKSRAARRTRAPNVAVLYGLSPVVAAGPGTFAHDLLTVAGATDAIAPSPQEYPHVSPTTLLAADPPVDALLLAGMDAHGDDTALPPALAAKARTLRSPGFLQPGPRTAEALEELAALLDDLAGVAP